MANLEEILQTGGAVILPTETVYGLFAQAMNEEAVEHVYRLKCRPKDKAMNLNVADYETILAFSKNQPTYLKKLYDAFLPGPLTIILQANDRVPAWINSGLSTIGFRIPKHPQTLALIKETGPLIGPSANISGQETLLNDQEVYKQFKGKIKMIVKGECKSTLASTVIKVDEDVTILRQGCIQEEEIREVLK